ncbi:MAG: four helix bundle protein [Patescibacteria group bacterium]
MKILNFTDLLVWKEGHSLVLAIYEATKSFPREEMFGLTSQIRRAVISITSNIAEGFGRKSKKEKVNFYNISSGSLTEVQNQLMIAKDLGYISCSQFDLMLNKSVGVYKMLNGLIRSISVD